MSITKLLFVKVSNCECCTLTKTAAQQQHLIQSSATVLCLCASYGYIRFSVIFSCIIFVCNIILPLFILSNWIKNIVLHVSQQQSCTRTIYENIIYNENIVRKFDLNIHWYWKSTLKRPSNIFQGNVELWSLSLLRGLLFAWHAHRPCFLIELRSTQGGFSVIVVL